MPYDKVWQAFYAMETIHSEDVLEKLMIASFPNIKQNSQKKIESSYKRLTTKHRESDVKTMTPEELAYGVARKQLDGQ